MSSFFYLTKDTTEPEINVISPGNTMVGNTEYFRIESNEQLSNIQEFYFIDSKGDKHDLILDFHETYFDGTYQFNNVSDGQVILNALVYDEVLNPSRIVQIPIDVYSRKVFVELLEYKKVIEFSELEKNLVISEQKKYVDLLEDKKQIIILESGKNIEIQEVKTRE